MFPRAATKTTMPFIIRALVEETRSIIRALVEETRSRNANKDEATDAGAKHNQADADNQEDTDDEFVDAKGQE